MPEPIKTDSLLQESRTFPPSPEAAKRAWISADTYQKMYDRSVKEPDAFWLEQAATLQWSKPPTVARRYNWNTAGRNIRTRGLKTVSLMSP
jgi:acetyl-CoA synthetase